MQYWRVSSMAPSAILVVLLISFLASRDVAAQQKACIAPTQGPGEAFPDVFSLMKQAFKFQVEANYITRRETHYITEYYDKTKSRGRLEINSGGEVTRWLYFGETDEFFAYSNAGYVCSSSIISEHTAEKFAPTFTPWIWIYKDDDSVVIGPSSMFQAALKEWDDNPDKIGVTKNRVLVRGMECFEYVWCKDENTTIKFYFTDPKGVTPFGLKEVPLRITGSGVFNGTGFFESFEFLGLDVDISKEELDDVFKIPAGIGCKRKPNLIEMKTIPQFKKQDFYIEAEMVYTPIKNGQADYTYINYIKIIFDKSYSKSGLVAFQTTTWKTHEKANIVNPGDSLFRIWDAHYGVSYEIDQATDDCKITQLPSNSITYVMTLPDGQKFKLWNENVPGSLFGENPEQYHYFGEDEERGIPASVFQRIADNNITFSEVSTVRYYLADNAVMENQFQEKNAPLKTMYYSFSMAAEEFSGVIALNYYSYQSIVPKKNELFDLRSCFTEDNQSKWVQILFPMDNYDPNDVIPQIPMIKDNFLGILLAAINLQSHLRIPRFEVDVDSNNIYITLLLLERHNVAWDFVMNMGDGLTFNDNIKDSTQIMGVMTLEECAKTCVEDKDCQYFSYCGAVCTKAVGKFDTRTDFKKHPDCQVHNSLNKPDRSPTMDSLSKLIAGAVETASLYLPLVDKKGRVMDFRANLFKDDVAFGLEGLSRKPEGLNFENRISTYKTGYTLKKVPSVEFQGLVSFPSCKQACVDSGSCETMSYCMTGRTCFLSDLVIDESNEASLTESNIQCMVLRRNYEDHFERLPGFAVAKTAERVIENTTLASCASTCFKLNGIAFTCLSFDYCEATRSCLLHKKHYKNLDEAKSLQVAETCGHYSRKLLYGFKKNDHKDLSGNQVGTIIYDVTPEECARYCRNTGQFVCEQFDFCADNFSTNSTCTLYKTSVLGLRENKKCNAYTKK